MATKMKGICKGFFTHLFVVKERDIEIGYPTDVKHVAHIGLDGPDGSAPSWMSDFKTGSDFSAASIGSTMSLSREQTWSSQEFHQQSSIGRQPSSTIYHNFPPANVPKIPKKQKRKKKGGKSSSSSSASSPKKSSSSPMSTSSSRSSRLSGKSKLIREENENQHKF